MTVRPLLSDVSVLPETTAPRCTEAQHDATVRVVLRWAVRTHARLADVQELCAVLGLDTAGVLERARETR